MKELVAAKLAERVKDGELLGVGTGTTVLLALEKIAERVKKENLKIQVLSTSYQTAWKCQEIGLTVLGNTFEGMLSWGFDGADEVDDKLRLIKGRRGALLREKILAAACKEYVIIVDDSKLVSRLGEKFSVPVEFVPEAKFIVEKGLRKLGAESVTLRISEISQAPIVTELGNITFDVKFKDVHQDLENQINQLVGVVDNGIFTDYATEVLIGSSSGVTSRIKSSLLS